MNKKRFLIIPLIALLSPLDGKEVILFKKERTDNEREYQKM